MKTPYLFTLVAAAIVGLSSCSEDAPTNPVVSSVSPEYGLPGTEVIITGNRFSEDANSITVDFNGTTAEVVSASKTELKVIVPEGATPGKVSIATNAGTGASKVEFDVLVDIPREGLVAFYPFFGDATDATENGSNGAVNGPVSSADRFGKPDQSFAFDGVDDHINVGNPAALQISNNITVGCWVKSDRLSTQFVLTKIFFDPDKGGNPTRGYCLYQADNNLATAFYSTTTLTLSTYFGSIAQSEWTFMAVSIEGLNYILYEDGQVIAEGTRANAIMDDGTLGDLKIGSYGGGFFFGGDIDDLTIYDRALSVDELNQLYTQTISKY